MARKANQIKKKPVSRKGETHKRGMTDMAWNFCHAYVRIGRARAAALSVGCKEKSAHVTANRWLKNDKVVKKIKALKRKLNKKLELSVESVIDEYMKLAFTNLTDLVDMSEGVPRFKDLEMIKAEHMAALQSVSNTPNGVKFKMHDKRGALDSLAKHLGMFVEEHRHSGEIIIKTDSDDNEL